MNQIELPFDKAPKEPASQITTLATAGQQKVFNVIQHLTDNPISDYVRKGSALVVKIDGNPANKGLKVLHLDDNKSLWSIHNNALGQICAKLRIPPTYVRHLLDENQHWAYNLVAHNLNTLLDDRVYDKKFLLRAVNGEVRGFLSNAYGRFDTIALIDAFSASCVQVDAAPYDGFWSDLRIAVQSTLKNVYEVTGQKLKAGVILKHSDFGLGAMEVRFFLAVNGRSLIGRSGLRKIHKGKRLKEDTEHNDTLMSQDSKELAKRMHGLIYQHLAPENISAVMAEVELAGSTAVDVDKISAVLESLELNEDEARMAKEAFLGIGAGLPPGVTLLRLATSIAWVADETQDVDRKLELMETAGKLVMKEKK